MSKLKISAMVAVMALAVSVFAQTDQSSTTKTTTTTTVTTSPSVTTEDNMKASMQASDLLSDPNVHWTIKEQTALLVAAPYVRPSDMWEINHMFHNMSGNDQRVIYTALTNAIRYNAGDYYTKLAAERAYWNAYYNNPATVTTTVTSTPSGATAVTTTTTEAQSMVGAGSAVYKGMSEYGAYELLQKDLNADDRTTFRMLWDNMTSAQQDALIDIARQSNYYFAARRSGIYYNPY